MSVNTVKSISHAIGVVIGKYGAVTVAYVKQTDAWRRTYVSDEALADFTTVVEKEAKSGALDRDVTTVALLQA
ncbi:hypothetical protein ONZ43_g6230 [Nemania bipapillata]|uniref:Uncharacterized protein n=1 Tax=Nemania bipapillata TaxID=110536 RepID=A0ACC2I194_9PEZI|nr:hypothetical protein ONZ43_g6230 [Nemania bipapillata]